MPNLSVNGIDLHYKVAGDGPPLLLIAGFASDSASWAPVAPQLAQSRRLIMPDNRGSGRTQSGDAPVTLRDYAEDCVALMDHLGLRRIDIVGHSMGGAVAMEIASVWPARTGKLIIAASPPRTTGHSRAVIESLTALREAGARDEDWFRNFFCWIFARSFFDDRRAVDAAIAMSMGYPYKQSAADMRRQCDSIKSVDLTPRLAAITAETLVLAGESDLVYPLSDVQRAYEDLPNVRLETVAGAAHSLHWDRPEAFISAVSRFLDGP